MAISKDDIVERNFRITNNNAIDMHVGKRVRLRRTLLGMSQNSLVPSLMLPFSKYRNMSVAQTGSAHHGCGISVKFLMCRSAIFSMICRKAQCVARRAGSAVAIMQTF